MISARQLSDVEARFFCLQRDYHGSTQVVTRIRLPGRWSAPTMRERLRAWSASHPLLLARVEQRDAALWFDYGERAADQPRADVAAPDFDPADELASELNTPLPSGAVLWRLRAHILPDAAELYLTRNHAISDAYTTRWLVNSLIEAVSGAGPHGLRGQPLLTERGAHAYRRPAATAAAARGDQPAVRLQPFMRQAPLAQRRTAVISRTLSARQSLGLKAFCRANRITVNQLFAALMMQAYASLSNDKQLNFHTAINTRNRYAEHAVANGLGCNIGVLKTALSLTSERLLDTARLYRDRLAQADALWTPAGASHAALLREVAALGQATAFDGICLTNSGAVDPPPALARHASLVQTVVNRCIGNYALVLHLSSFGGAFHLNFTHAAPTLSADFGLAVVDRLLTRIDQVVTERHAAACQPSPT